MKILLTGGAGYIGSHTAVALVAAGFDPIILDNFANSHPVMIEHVATIDGRHIVLELGDGHGSRPRGQDPSHLRQGSAGKQSTQLVRNNRHNICGRLQGYNYVATKT